MKSANKSIPKQPLNVILSPLLDTHLLSTYFGTGSREVNTEPLRVVTIGRE